MMESVKKNGNKNENKGYFIQRERKHYLRKNTLLFMERAGKVSRTAKVEVCSSGI